MVDPVLNDARQQPLLSVRNLRTCFDTARGTLRAVDGVSFDVAEGETFGIVGESGSGKSVLVRSIMNLLPRSATVSRTSTIMYNGNDIRAMSPVQSKHFWGPEIAMVFQDPMTSLNPVRKISAQITESMRYHLGMTAKQAASRAIDLLNEVGIPEPKRRMEQYPHELSGGMRQRITIATALACEPRLLIADEPTTALDVTVQKQILDLLARLQREHKMGMILISHDLGVVSGISDRVAVMYAGQMVEVAPSDIFFSDVHHPYSEALLQSIPLLDRPSHMRLQAIKGRPPDMAKELTGCRFSPRCRYAQDICLAETPTLVGGEGSKHGYRCFFPISSPRGQAALAHNLQVGHTAAGLDMRSEVTV